MMRKFFPVGVGCLMALTLVVSVLRPQDRWAEPFATSEDGVVSDRSTKHYISGNHKAESDVSIKGYLTRQEALIRYPPLADIRNVVSMQRSLIKIQGENRTYRVGDKIVLSITLRDGSGRRRDRGGDKLHVRIYNTTYGAYASGHVIDHDNGAYTAKVPALWPGVSIIATYLAFPRETIRVMYATKQQTFSTRPIYGRYESGQTNETVLCQPAKEYFHPSEELCDFTKQNGGMPWYCGKPKCNPLQCKDLASVRAPPFEFIQQTEAERQLFQSDMGGYHYSQIEMNITVEIKGTRQSREELPACSSVPKAKTWMQSTPSGFFYWKQWCPTFCKLPSDKYWNKCLFGRNIAFVGDSTIRQWYEYMRNELNCTQVTEIWTTKTWHRRSKCVNKLWNFTASFIPHGRPFYLGKNWTKPEIGTKSTIAYLDEIHEEKIIIVIHMFAHAQHYRNEIFQDRMNAISSGVRRLLSRNKNAVVLLKGPHTFNAIMAYNYYMYRAIMKETFKGLHDRVVFMEQGDMTIAKSNKDIHPNLRIVREAIRQLIGYIC